MSLDLARFDALTFDCYGTLIDWERGIIEQLRPWARRHGLDLTDEALLEAYAEAEAELERTRPTLPYRQLLLHVHQALAARLGTPESHDDAARLAGSVGSWPAFADTTAALRSLARRCRLVIVSNVDRISFAGTQEVLGVDFDAVITAEEVGAYKPDLKVFEHALERLDAMGIGRDRVLHVAQSLFHDHVPAKQLGLTTAWIDRRQGRPGWGATPPPPSQVQPDLHLASMAELAGLMAEGGGAERGR